jgi:hypothetical protein
MSDDFETAVNAEVDRRGFLTGLAEVGKRGAAEYKEDWASSMEAVAAMGGAEVDLRRRGAGKPWYRSGVQ